MLFAWSWQVELSEDQPAHVQAQDLPATGATQLKVQQVRSTLQKLETDRNRRHAAEGAAGAFDTAEIRN